ncbi:MAG: hypothetical protein M5U26_15250 [Planctomycetota bacterium]|nr:hypothetical protein [Planctomycetota bacterium]
MFKLLFALAGLLPIALASAHALAGEAKPEPNWSKGPPSDPGFFPLAVWLQAPANAPRYKAAGINTYIGLWQGPTEEQLAELKKHGMKVICAQNEVGLKHKDDETIVAWMHGDEPDNAQPKQGGGYGPPVPPETIIEDYKKLKANDPDRPVILNLGQGVAWDGWHGRGVRTNHPEDYAEYIKGCDLVSFDIYPACHDKPDVAGKLWLVPFGVQRLREWSKDEKAVWNCIECTRIGNTEKIVTPQEMKCEVWMSLIYGSKGIIYFCHQFKPKFIEAGLLAEPELLAMATKVNRQILELAPVLNGPSVAEGAKVETDGPAVAVMTKRHEGATYVFAVVMRGAEAQATFTVPGVQDGSATVLGEDRKVPVAGGTFKDRFQPWDVHLYKIE